MTYTQETGHVTPRDKIRWFSIKNTEEEETIPAFGICYIMRDAEEELLAQEEENGRLIFLVKQPDDICAALQDPALLIINGPVPIKPDKTGFGAQDWPAQVLHKDSDLALDVAPDFRPEHKGSVGPRSGSWMAWRSGCAFTQLSPDATEAVKDEDEGISTIWITPATNRQKWFPIRNEMAEVPIPEIDEEGYEEAVILAENAIIPAYGLCMLTYPTAELDPETGLPIVDPTRSRVGMSQVIVAGVIVTTVNQCSSGAGNLLGGRNNAMLMVANGPEPILPGRIGRGTQDWPARVLHDGTEYHDQFLSEGSAGVLDLGVSYRVGPMPFSWCVWSSKFDDVSWAQAEQGPRSWWAIFGWFGALDWGGERNGLNVISYDIRGTFPHDQQTVHTVWVDGAKRTATQIILAGASSPGSVVGGSPLALPASTTAAGSPFGVPGVSGGSTAGIGDSDTVEFIRSGPYWLSVSGTLSSVDAADGDILTYAIATRKIGESVFSDTYLTGYRTQHIDGDLTTEESVFFAGPYVAEAGEQLQIVNRSADPLTVGSLILASFAIPPTEV